METCTAVQRLRGARSGRNHEPARAASVLAALRAQGDGDARELEARENLGQRGDFRQKGELVGDQFFGDGWYY